jgi:hypothetical protein
MSATEPLLTVEDYIAEARVLLLDKVRPYRYEDDELLAALNLAVIESRRLRADLFVRRRGSSVPYFATVSSVEVGIEMQFRLGFLYGIVAHAMIRDEEDVQDARANTFYGRFHDILVGTKQRAFPAGAQGPNEAKAAKKEGAQE